MPSRSSWVLSRWQKPHQVVEYMVNIGRFSLRTGHRGTAQYGTTSYRSAMIPCVLTDAVLAGLDPEQRTAGTAPAGPVCILAGAGTGKTRAITHRIGYRTLTGEISPRHILAVTFTARAAAEMRARLGALGAVGVQARTFHAAALRQVRYFAPRLLEGRQMPELLESKGRLVALAAARHGLRLDRAVARDVAGEIEWAKSSLVEPGEYAVAATKALREL